LQEDQQGLAQPGVVLVVVGQPKLHEAWVEEVGETHIRVRPTASPFGEMIGHDHEVRWLHQPEDFVVVKGHDSI
jgi:hypothetical protein